jgi:hypothetical protein
MDKSKISPQEIYEVLEEQKKLLEVRSKLVGILEKVNHTINSLAVIKHEFSEIRIVNMTIYLQVENLQLTQCIDLSDNEDQEVIPPFPVTSPPEPSFSYNQLEQSELINQQMIEIDVKPCFEEIDSDEELEHL